MLDNSSCFCCRLLTSVKINFLKKKFRYISKVSNCLDPDSFGPDLAPNCFQMLSADDKSRC